MNYPLRVEQVDLLTRKAEELAGKFAVADAKITEQAGTISDLQAKNAQIERKQRITASVLGVAFGALIIEAVILLL